MMKGRGNMLAMSDIYIDQFFPVFANAGLPVAFLVPTPTGYDKSIMDAIATVRTLLKETDIHQTVDKVPALPGFSIVYTVFLV